MEIPVAGDKPPNILAFDSTRAKPADAVPVDLESPFFTVKHRPDYPACDHHNRGVTLDVATRRAICLCGEVIDCFDALLLYAHAQQRLVRTRAAITEHYRKEAETKAKRPFVRDVVGFDAETSKRGRILGYRVKLACGHYLYAAGKRTPPRTMTCTTCFKQSQIAEAGVAGR